MTQRAFSPPQRLLLGPGPSPVAPTVLRALSLPTVGHLDPELFMAMDEIRANLRGIFGTQNSATFAVSGTGTSGMEAVLTNLIEPGDGVLVATHGYFGARIAEIAARCGGDVTRIDGEWGKPSDPGRARSAARGKPIKVVAVVHAETSTGVRQELGPWRELAAELGALLCVDAVTSLGCIPIEVDANGVDGIWSCTQKGLSSTPGLAPVSFSPRAVERVRARTSGVRSFYFDLRLLLDYWDAPHSYHHTISSNLLYGLHEATRLVLEEGLAARFERHERVAAWFRERAGQLGLEPFVEAGARLPQLTTLRIPQGIDDLRVRTRLLGEHGIEIGGGLGALKGQLWRVGLMGHGATESNAQHCLEALTTLLESERAAAPRADPRR
jgi:alanine-glyoxylate transaminase/serine-glyoxylate transaminase/serine-pyruvate transaminase